MPDHREPLSLDAARSRAFVATVDMADEEPYRAGHPHRRAIVDLGRARSAVRVPLIKDGTPCWACFVIYRQEVRPFADKEIALVENFAAQAVIAMENARLITETREALDQQTATAEVLGVINSSPGDLAPVFDKMLDKALTLCGAAIGSMFRYDGVSIRQVAHRGHRGEAREVFREFVPQPGDAFEELVRGADLVHIADVVDTDAYRAGIPGRVKLVEDTGARTALWVALRKDDTLLGAIVVHRTEVRPFSEKQIALLQNFAAQAVIAMENARLLTETRERTRDLQQSLEYQTATSDVLKVISRSPVDLGAVFDFVCETAARLCRVHVGSIFRLDKGVYRFATGFGMEPEYRALEEQAAIPPGAGTLVGRVAMTGKPVHILDGTTDPLYEAKDELRLSKARTMWVCHCCATGW